jgi:periplasmic copper chaperone A
MITLSRARRTGLALLVGVGIALVPALTASAHVTVSSPDAAAGGFGKLVFRVPSESDTANTTSLTVQLPADTPFRFVSIGVNPGWTAEATTTQLPEPIESDGFTITEAVTSVSWTADGEGLPPHQFTEFQLSVGPFPSGVEQFVFPATQTYSDGEVVEWSEVVAEGEPEPEHPAPVLDLSGDSASADATDDDDDDTLVLVLAIVGAVLGAAGLAVGLSARRSRTPQP